VAVNGYEWVVSDPLFDHGGAFIARELHEEEQRRLLAQHDELRFNRCRVRWATKHPGPGGFWTAIGSEPAFWTGAAPR
jgi:hypothetical protein